MTDLSAPAEGAAPSWRRRVDTLLLWGAIVGAAACGITGLFFDDWRVRRLLSIYTWPLLLVGPLWLRGRVRENADRARGLLAIDLLVFALGMARFSSGSFLPFSGHTLFLTYASAVTRQPAYRLACVALLLGTSYFKLWIWRDPVSWTWGLSLGLAFAAAALLLARRTELASRQT